MTIQSESPVAISPTRRAEAVLAAEPPQQRERCDHRERPAPVERVPDEGGECVRDQFAGVRGRGDQAGFRNLAFAVAARTR